jgi:hypothetical protein
MPVKNLVEVSVLLDGQAAAEYQDPTIADTGNKVVRYIKVKAGQKFGVNVTWLAG